MNIFEFLQEMAGEIPYEQRKVKGSYQRQECAAKLLEEQREEWLSWMDKEEQ